METSAHRPPALRIGPHTFSPPMVLAPMSGLTTGPMRTLCEEAGCGLTVTEFLAAPALSTGVPKEVSKIGPSPTGRPFSAQIFGRNPEQMARAARLVVQRGASLVDINMGCPARKVTKGVSGAALMREPELAEALVQAVKQAVPQQVPVTVKIRSGWDASERNAPQFAARMVAAGAQAVAVHGRTRMQGYKGTVDLEVIARVKQAVPVPVIGNGDVVDRPSLEQMFARTGCDAVMVGRASLGNPWIFEDFHAWWRGEPAPTPPTARDKMLCYLRHLDLQRSCPQAARAVVEMRKFAGWYLRGFPGAAALRKTIYGLLEPDAIHQAIREALPPPGTVD